MAALRLLCSRIHSANTSQCNLICIDTYLWLRSAVFWDFSQRRVVIPYQRFGTTYRFYLQTSRCVSPSEDGPIGCTEMSVRNYHSKLRNIPEEHRKLHRGGRLKLLANDFFFPDRACQYNTSNWPASQNCPPDGHSQSVMIPDAAQYNLTSWWWAQQCSKHIEEYNKLITKQEFVH